MLLQTSAFPHPHLPCTQAVSGALLTQSSLVTHSWQCPSVPQTPVTLHSLPSVHLQRPSTALQASPLPSPHTWAGSPQPGRQTPPKHRASALAQAATVPCAPNLGSTFVTLGSAQGVSTPGSFAQKPLPPAATQASVPTAQPLSSVQGENQLLSVARQS